MLPNFSRGMLKKQPRHFFFKELTQNYVLNNEFHSQYKPFLTFVTKYKSCVFNDGLQCKQW